MHAHNHSHSGHTHSAHCHHAVPTTPAQVKALRIALVLVASFSVAELWVSLHSNSLSLMADAGHMVTDVFAIALSLWTAMRTAQLSSEAAAKANHEWLNALAALINGALLLAVSGWLAWEAVGELRSPPTEILSSPVAITAAVGLCINGINAYFLHAHAADNLNIKGAFLHMVADASSCLGVLVGAVLIAQFGWYRADGWVSGAIALLIFTTAFPLIRQSWTTLTLLAAKTPAAKTPAAETPSETI